jgi:hypothetical protein
MFPSFYICRECCLGHGAAVTACISAIHGRYITRQPSAEANTREFFSKVQRQVKVLSAKFFRPLVRQLC